MPARWTDNHCHLPADLDAARALVEAARAAGVERFVDVGCDVAQSREAAARAAAIAGVSASVGIHPHDARTAYRTDAAGEPVGPPDLAPIEALLGRPGVVAVGEAGLDYHYDHSPRPQQREVFAAHIRVAHRHDLPLVIHTREAWADTFAILDDEGVPRRAVLHCFTGGPHEAEAALARGLHLSFSGIVTFPSAPEVREAARLCPDDRFMVETDAPYLAPVPFRGQKNRPELVTHVGAAVAEARDRPVEDVAAVTWATASRFYGLD